MGPKAECIGGREIHRRLFPDAGREKETVFKHPFQNQLGRREDLERIYRHRNLRPAGYTRFTSRRPPFYDRYRQKLKSRNHGAVLSRLREAVQGVVNRLGLSRITGQDSKNVSMQDAWKEMYRFSVGHPSLLRLNDSELLAYWYAGKNHNNTRIEYARIKCRPLRREEILL